MLSKPHLHRILLFFLAILIPVGLVATLPVPTTKAESIQELLEEQQRIKNQLNETKNRSSSLAEELSRVNNQIRLNELEIQDIQQHIQTQQALIVQANAEIKEVQAKLDRLEKLIEEKQDAVKKRLRESYKTSKTPKLATIFATDSFQGAMRHYEYLKRVEEEDSKLISQMSQTQKKYTSQKDSLQKLKAEKQASQDRLKQQHRIAEQKASEIEQHRNQQANLLARSKNDESYYAQLLAENEARVASMRSILASGISSGQYMGSFKKGEIIGYSGSSGCSTGPHLHFGMIRGGGFVNPWNYLGRSVNGISYGYPHGGYTSYINPYTAGYVQFGNGHSGLDTSIGHGTALTATADGNAYFHIPYGKQDILNSSWCPSWAKPFVTSAQYEIWLEHADGTISQYAHISSPVVK